MRENRQSGSEGGGTKPIASPYPYNSFDRCAVQECPNLSPSKGKGRKDCLPAPRRFGNNDRMFRINQDRTCPLIVITEELAI